MKKLTFMLVILFTGISTLKLSAKLPFENGDELNSYVRKLSSKTLESAKSLEDYLDPVGKEPTDPVLLTGIKLFNSGDIDKAIKYFSKISKNRKYSDKLQEYAEYQLFHIAYFGMLDYRYNGRPTKMDRSRGAKYGSFYFDIKNPSYAILAGLYPSVINKNIWGDLNRFWSYGYKEWDIDFLHAFLKATIKGRELKDFPFKISKISIYREKDGIPADFKLEPQENCKDISDYMTTNRTLPNIQILRKGIELDLNGWHDKALKYFVKLSKVEWKYNEIDYREYAKYQCWHILNFGETDPYYNGKPSNISRRSLHYKVSRLTDYPSKYKKFRKKYYFAAAPLNDYLIIAASLLKDNVIYDYDFSHIENYFEDTPVYDFEYVNSVLNAMFLPGSDARNAIQYYNSLSDVLKLEYKDLKTFDLGVSLDGYLSRMKVDKNNNLGIGLNANQLFEAATEILPPMPELKFDKGYNWKDKKKMEGKINNYLLKSAILGNSAAMNTFIAYNLAAVNSYDYSEDNAYVNFNRSKKLKEFLENLDNLPSLNQHKLIINQYKSLVDEIYSYHKEVYDEYKAEQYRAEQARKEEKRRRRAELWGNIGMAMLQGAVEGLNIYSQLNAQKQYSSYNSTSGSRGSSSSKNRGSSSSKSRSSSGSNSISKMSSQQVWDQYLNPVTFAYNYTHGLPTLPSSAQLGLTGTNAYSYDLERNLQHRSQLMDLQAMKETQQLVDQGMKMAQKEISDFQTINGRMPTEQEMRAIYSKYTQGYLDSYSEYVTDNIATNKELGLGTIERTKPSVNSSSYNSTSSSNSQTSGSTSSSYSKDNGTSQKTKVSSNSGGTSRSSSGSGNKSDSSGYDAHEQYKSGNINTNKSSYGDKIKNVSMAVKDGSSYRNVSLHGELYKKGSEHFVKIGNTFFKVRNIAGVYNSTIVYGAVAYYFNR